MTAPRVLTLMELSAGITCERDARRDVCDAMVLSLDHNGLPMGQCDVEGRLLRGQIKDYERLEE